MSERYLSPPRLTRGDTVALLTPASWAEDAWIAETAQRLTDWGWRVRLGGHVRNRLGYLAGSDADRLTDLHAAIRDPEVRAIVCAMGGCGSLRLVRVLDRDALRADPKPIVGFSDITALHLLWQRAGVVSLHGAVAGNRAETVRDLLLGGTPQVIAADRTQYGAELTTGGRATGWLVGGNLEMLARSVGVTEVPMAGHVLLLEINRAAGLGMVDRALTQLIDSGTLDGVTGVALGVLEGFDGYHDRGWNVLDVLSDRLGLLGVPILAGLPLGHTPNPVTVPLGVRCELDADAGTLRCGPALR
ncbi:MAG: LD-carboxypeptidase [Micropruina sp.]|uniref:S66 peptidase family protein n=1 Tax=Micropruina sp. TaxID=2737536 RepID=UPI0039E6F5F8